MILRKGLHKHSKMGLRNLCQLLPILLTSFFWTSSEAVTLASMLCDTYHNNTAGWIDAYYEPQENRCAIFVRYPGATFENLTMMCNQLAQPIHGRCQIGNTYNQEIKAYLNSSIIAPNDEFFIGLVRQPDCGPWEWIHYDGTKTLQPTNASSDCNMTNALYFEGSTKAVYPDAFVNTTGILCQCYEPQASPTQPPPTGNSTEEDPVIGNVTQASPADDTTPSSAEGGGMEWIILLGTSLFFSMLIHSPLIIKRR